MGMVARYSVLEELNRQHQTTWCHIIEDRSEFSPAHDFFLYWNGEIQAVNAMKQLVW